MRTRTEEVYQGFMAICDSGYESFNIPSTFQMGVTKIQYDEDKNVLNVHLRRPGLLIGKMGQTVGSLERMLECKIAVHEVRKLWEEPFVLDLD
jgi:hypothetical protein